MNPKEHVGAERARFREEAEELQANAAEAAQPKNPGSFERWLKLKAQQKRDDDTGRVARWVRSRIEAGEWFDSKRMATQQGSRKVAASYEQLLRTWRGHLQGYHGLSGSSVEMFERAFYEWQEARDRYHRSFTHGSS